MTPPPDDEPTRGIGAVSETTGIPKSTLRTWERRYGFPDPDRNEAGHRRYAPGTIDRLRSIQRLLDRGHRASDVVTASPDELETLLEESERTSSEHPGGNELTRSPDGETDEQRASAPGEERPSGSQLSSSDTTDRGARTGRTNREPDMKRSTASGSINETIPGLADASAPSVGAPAASPADEPWLLDWLDSAQRIDTAELQGRLRREWTRIGALAFLVERAAPFLRAIGDRWANGQLSVRHEHGATAVLRDFLGAHWRRMSGGSNAPTAVCATVAGERHGLGLHMATVVLALAGWQPRFIGVDTPVDELVDACREDATAKLLALSFAPSFPADRASKVLRDLRESLPDDTEIVVGGTGAPDRLDVARRFDDLESFYTWAREALES